MVLSCLTSVVNFIDLQFIYTTRDDIPQVDPVISPLLQRVLKARPQDVASFAAQDLQQLALAESPPRESLLAS